MELINEMLLLILAIHIRYQAWNINSYYQVCRKLMCKYKEEKKSHKPGFQPAFLLNQADLRIDDYKLQARRVIGNQVWCQGTCLRALSGVQEKIPWWGSRGFFGSSQVPEIHSFSLSTISLMFKYFAIYYTYLVIYGYSVKNRQWRKKYLPLDSSQSYCTCGILLLCDEIATVTVVGHGDWQNWPAHTM